MTAYNALKNRLDNSKIKFYTYTPKHLKLKNTVLKGVIGDFTIKDIKLDIEAMNLPNVKIEKITKVNFGKSKFPNFIVQLSHDSELSSLTKIKTILHQVVRWEPLRKSQTYQCRNCQRINHTSSNCFLGYRCVKCDQPNEPGQCALSQDCTDKSKIYCVKCEELGHPALYRSCPYLKLASKVLKNISERRATKLTKIKETLLVNSSNNQNFIGKTAYERPRMNTVNKPRDDIPSTNRWIPRSNEILFGDNNIPPARPRNLTRNEFRISWVHAYHTWCDDYVATYNLAATEQVPNLQEGLLGEAKSWWTCPRVMEVDDGKSKKLHRNVESVGTFLVFLL
ncbi:hypothetical protein TKK_0005007 [Trichogramma kaykai]